MRPAKRERLGAHDQEFNAMDSQGRDKLIEVGRQVHAASGLVSSDERRVARPHEEVRIDQRREYRIAESAVERP